MKVLIALCMVTLFAATCQGQRQWRPNYQRQSNWYPQPQAMWWGGDWDDAFDNDNIGWALQQPYGYMQPPMPMMNQGYNPRMWGPAAMAAVATGNDDFFSNSGELLMGLSAGGMPQAMAMAGGYSPEFFDL